MEKHVAEYLVYLKDNASELRKLGKEWGMTEKEIDECVTEALAGTDKQEELRSSPKNTARTCWGYFLVSIKFMIAVSVVLICLSVVMYVVVIYHKPTQDVVMKVAMHYSYSIMRTIRLAAVPLHGMFNITNLYSEECLVNNPFFAEIQPNCEICRRFKAVQDHNASGFTAVKFHVYANAMKPVKLVNTLDKNVTYKDLRESYLGLYGKEQHEFVSAGPNQMSLDDFFFEDKEELVNTSESLQVHWITRTVRASAALRKLFPRPSYIPAELEVTLEKVVMIDGPNSTPHKLPTVHTGHIQLFIMGSGSRPALVRPIDGCRDDCNTMLVFMEPGDTLMYNADMWRIYLGTNGHVPMVGYILQLQM